MNHDWDEPIPISMSGALVHSSSRKCRRCGAFGGFTLGKAMAQESAWHMSGNKWAALSMDCDVALVEMVLIL